MFSIPVVLDSMYVRRHYNMAASEIVNKMINGVRQLMAENLWSDVEWMDNVTKKRAEQKLNGIIQVVGYQQQLLSDAKLEQVFAGVNLENLTYFEASQQLMAWERFEKILKLRRPVDFAEDWADFSMSSAVNAFFAPNKNLICELCY